MLRVLIAIFEPSKGLSVIFCDLPFFLTIYFLIKIFLRQNLKRAMNFFFYNPFIFFLSDHTSVSVLLF